MNLIKKVKEDRVDKAIEVIKGYCSKHTFCEDNCRFYNKEKFECVFEKGTMPCDWKEGEEE